MEERCLATPFFFLECNASVLVQQPKAHKEHAMAEAPDPGGGLPWETQQPGRPGWTGGAGGLAPTEQCTLDVYFCAGCRPGKLDLRTVASVIIQKLVRGWLFLFGLVGSL